MKYSYRTLFRIRQFYNLFSSEKVSAIPTQLTWSHYSELLVLKYFDEINYYINIAIQQNLTYRQLHDRIKLNEYERLDEKTKLKLINKEETKVEDFIKNPIIIKNNSNYEYNCFVVVELKVTELKKEHIGQMQVYMNYVDKTINKVTQDKTIGIIICRKDNKYIIEYCSDNRIISKEYELV